MDPRFRKKEFLRYFDIQNSYLFLIKKALLCMCFNYEVYAKIDVHMKT